MVRQGMNLRLIIRNSPVPRTSTRIGGPHTSALISLTRLFRNCMSTPFVVLVYGMSVCERQGTHPRFRLAVRPCYHWAAWSPSEPVGNSNATGMPAFQEILSYQLVKNFQQPVARSRCIEFDTEAFGSLGLLPWSVRIHFDTLYLNRYIAATDWRSGGSIADRCAGATVSDRDVYGSR